MATPLMMGDPGPARKGKRRLYALGAFLVIGVPVITLFAAAVERVRDAAERAN
jgi:hypothetical protein